MTDILEKLKADIDLAAEKAKQKIDQEVHRLTVKHDWEVLKREIGIYDFSELDYALHEKTIHAEIMKVRRNA